MKYIRTTNKKGETAMRYIRAEDNIWEVLQEDDLSFIVDDPHTPPPFDVYTVLKTEVIKGAETIKDLCDFFVVHEIGGGCVGEYRTYRDLELAKYSMDDKVSVLYGAIVVLGAHGEPILKPIAKMDEKGELRFLWKQPKQKSNINVI